ncbi:cobalamin B12-binding domain-containing protein [[Eubacterium] cellulosolvens]
MKLEGFKEAFANLEGEERVQDIVTEALNSGVSPVPIINAMSEALDKIGSKYQKGDLFLSDLIMAGLMANTVSALLDPYFKTDYKGTLGIVVIGTVKGDLHDIGKNLVRVLLESTGFKVIDLGVDVNPDKFIEAIVSYSPQILAMSCLLTAAIDEIKNVMTLLRERGLREEVKVLIGGRPITKELAQEIGADGYSADAIEAVDMAQRLIKEA